MGVSFTTYSDDALYTTSLTITLRADLSKDGPRVNFATFVEWTLARNGSYILLQFHSRLSAHLTISQLCGLHV